jgi:excinuclease ABC subunit B
VNAEVILYADSVTGSMSRAMSETNRRRALQEAYNVEHGITPETVKKSIRHDIGEDAAARKLVANVYGGDEDNLDVEELVNELENEMYKAAGRLDFEEAARLRDEILRLKPDHSAVIMTPKKRKSEALAKEKRHARETVKKYRNFDRRKKSSG